MAILTGLAILLYACYTAFVLKSFGIPKSYSATYYLLGGKGGDGWIFQVIMGVVAFLALISGLDTGGYWNFLAFIPAVALLFVCFAPDYRYSGDKTIENKVHIVAAYIAAIGSAFAFWLKFNAPMPAAGYALFVIVVTTIDVPKKTFWIEHVCFDIYLALLFISQL